MKETPFSVCLLGTGTCVPSAHRSAAAALVTLGESNILLDVGPGTMRRLAEAGRTVQDIDIVLLTHFHPDHTGELAAFLFANKYPGERRSPLTLGGGPGVGAFFNALKGVYGNWLVFDRAPFTVFEWGVDGERMKIPGGVVDAGPVRHNPESRAFRISSEDGRVLVYAGDTDTSDDLVSFAAGADLFVVEAAMPDGMKVPGHLTPRLAAEMARTAGVGKLVLTHFYPPCETPDFLDAAERVFGDVVAAGDLHRFDL